MSELENKPSRDEEDWAAREDVEKLRKLAFEQRQALAVQEQERLRALHHMKCSNCGMDLHTVHHGKVELQTCFNCKGVFLKEAALSQLVREGSHDPGPVMRGIFNLFKRELGK